jgi:hypothetical protein
MKCPLRRRRDVESSLGHCSKHLINTSRLYVNGNDDDDGNDDEDDCDDVMSMGELQDEAKLKSKTKNMRPRGKNVEFALSTISFQFGSSLSANSAAHSLAPRVTYVLADKAACLLAIECLAILVLCLFLEQFSQECFDCFAVLVVVFLLEHLFQASQELFASLPKRITRT